MTRLACFHQATRSAARGQVVFGHVHPHRHWELPALNRQRLLQRFVRYARIDTTADDSTDNYPSCAGQWELGRMLRHANDFARGR
jgi:hypothetical protein